jgi:hypothetical protein
MKSKLIENKVNIKKTYNIVLMMGMLIYLLKMMFLWGI